MSAANRVRTATVVKKANDRNDSVIRTFEDSSTMKQSKNQYLNLNSQDKREIVVNRTSNVIDTKLFEPPFIYSGVTQ